MKKLEEFHGSKNLALSDITPAYLSSYQNHLRESVGGNYTHGLIKTLRTFINAAKKDRLITDYPFEAAISLYDIEYHRISLSAPEEIIVKIKSLDTPGIDVICVARGGGENPDICL